MTQPDDVFADRSWLEGQRLIAKLMIRRSPNTSTWRPQPRPGWGNGHTGRDAAGAEDRTTQDDAVYVHPAPLCGINWGSHGCDLPHRAGNHQCHDEDGHVCSEVDQDGIDEGGWRWALYGDDADGNPVDRVTEPHPDTPSPLEQIARATELIRRRRITLICPAGRGGEFREVFAAESWAGLVEVVESDLLPDDGSVYVTRPGLLDIPDMDWPAPRIGGAPDE